MEIGQDYKYYSTLNLYRYFFEFLKIIGIFPFKINFDSKRKCLTEISYHKNGLFYFINILVISLFIFHNLLACIILIKNAVLGSRAEHLLELLSFAMTISFLNIVLLTFNLKKVKICNILNEWILVEAALIRGKTCTVILSNYKTH